MLKRLYIISFILLGFFTFSQNKVDSLKAAIESSSNDSLKAIAYTNLCNHIITQPKEVLEVLSEMNVFCNGIKNTKHKALCLRKIGAIYSFLNYYDRALEYTYQAADLFESINDKYGLAYCYNNIGNFYNYKGEFTKDKRFQERSIEYHLKSIQLRDTLVDTIPLQTSYNNIGNSYMAFGNYTMAINYYNKSFVMALHLKDPKPIEMINENLGNCYLTLAEKDNSQINYRKALMYYLNALKINYDGEITRTHANVNSSIGHIYVNLGENSLGFNYLKKGLDLAFKTQDKSVIMDAARRLSQAYEKNGDYAKALELLHLHNINKDSLINERNSSSIEEMQVLYQSSQKDREIEKLNNEKIVKDAELSRQRTIIISSIGAALSILILVLVLWSRFNLKKKANEQLADAYRKIELKNHQITDSINYSKRIQTAILPPIDLLNKHLQHFFIYYAPKDIVSGDFYWFSEHNNHMFFIVVDCTGHGVPGALMSMIGNTLLNEIINQKNITEPGEILNHLNKGVKNALRQGGSDMISQDDGMDVSICAIDRSKPNVLKYATANHSIFVKANEKVTELVGDIFSIGGDFGSIEKSFENKTHSLEPNSFVIMSTDGYYDQFGGDKDTKFLVSRFENIILNTDLKAADVSNQFEKALIHWKGLQKQTDDILVAGFKV